MQVIAPSMFILAHHEITYSLGKTPYANFAYRFLKIFLQLNKDLTSRRYFIDNAEM